MEALVRRHRPIQDQENLNVIKGKGSIVLAAKKGGLAVRGALGDLSTNIQVERDVNVGKVAVAAAEFEKKASLSRVGPVKSYSHVQSKVDTGLSAKAIQPSSRPPLRRDENNQPTKVTSSKTRPVLRREESTAGHAVKAVRSKVLKEAKTSEEVNIFIQTKKTASKKVNKLPSIKENKEKESVLKPILKESTESLGKLKLTEKNSLINHEKLDEVKLTPKAELPYGVEDIDKVDNNSPFLMTTYINDIYLYLKELEIKYPVESDYLQKQSEITAKMRATLLDWLVEVQRQFSLVLETFQLTVGIIDRYLQVAPNVQRNRLQLVGVTAMFIASKYEEIYSPDVDDFVYVTDRAFTKAEIFQCERDIMTKLGFCLARPIPLSFLRRFVKAAHGTSKNHHLAKYFVDLSMIEYSMAHYRPSELAAAAICLSLYLLSNKDIKTLWTPTLTYYSGYTFNEIEPIVKKIAKIVSKVDNSKFQAVYKKYLDLTLARVSGLPQLKSEVLYELADSASP